MTVGHNNNPIRRRGGARRIAGWTLTADFGFGSAQRRRAAMKTEHYCSASTAQDNGRSGLPAGAV
jgi:hypothetical protein